MPDDVDFATDQEIYNNQGPVGDKLTTYSTGSEDVSRREPDKVDHGREEEWVEFFTDSAESKTSTLACTKPGETPTNELDLCLKFVDNRTKIELEMVDLEHQEIKAREQTWENNLEVERIRYQIMVVKKAKEQAKLQDQMGKSTS